MPFPSNVATDSNPLHCPTPQPLPQPPYDLAELDSLLDYLASGEALTEAITFPHGTVQMDGRLDLCKQSLGVEGCRRVVKALKGHVGIRSLMLGTDAIGDEGAEAVARIVSETPRLETLYLGCNAIGPAGVDHLAAAIEQSPHVKALWLKRNPIGEAGALRLATLIRRAPHLRVLDLVHTRMDETALRPLIAAMLESDHIEHLYLGGNSLGEAIAAPLGELLARSTVLKGLYLNVNALGDSGCAVVVQGAIQGGCLRELGLGSNGFTSQCATSLSELLTRLPTLESLDLGTSPSTHVLGAVPNNLGDVTAQQIAESLPAARALRSLNLQKTAVGSAGKQALAQAILTHSSLVDLKLEDPGLALSAALASQRKRLGVPRGSEVSATIKSVYR